MHETEKLKSQSERQYGHKKKLSQSKKRRDQLKINECLVLRPFETNEYIYQFADIILYNYYFSAQFLYFL